MRNDLRNLRRAAVRALGLAVMAALVAASFLGVGNVYLRSFGGDKTFVLDRSQLEDGAEAGFRVEGAVKRHLADTVLGMAPLGGDRLFMSTQSAVDTSPARVSLTVLDVASERQTAVLSDAGLQTYALSPDKTTLVYQKAIAGANETVWYDLGAMRPTDTRLSKSGDWENWQSLLADGRVLELTNREVALRDLRTGRTDIVVTTDALESFLAAENRKGKLGLGKMMAMASSPNADRVYLQYFLPDREQSLVLSVDAATGDIAEEAAGDIKAFVPLRGGGVLLSGTLNGVEGLYSAASGQKPALLAEGAFASLAVDPARDVVAYVQPETAGMQSIKVARFGGGGLTDASSVYYVPSIVRSLAWSPDGNVLFGVSEGVSGSDVYRFQLR
ncbi:hypothetical protein [Paenibacillus sp. GCM10023250]|uniref:hypothetical protein n=1 Tax=Paenibacillus sp. GCM10023250 TaxID=3252648 RepID=UPI003622CDF8